MRGIFMLFTSNWQTIFFLALPNHHLRKKSTYLNSGVRCYVLHKTLNSFTSDQNITTTCPYIDFVPVAIWSNTSGWLKLILQDPMTGCGTALWRRRLLWDRMVCCINTPIKLGSLGRHMWVGWWRLPVRRQSITSIVADLLALGSSGTNVGKY